eukprot:s1091_g4.t1
MAAAALPRAVLAVQAVFMPPARMAWFAGLHRLQLPQPYRTIVAIVRAAGGRVLLLEVAAKSEEESYMDFLEPGEDWVPLHPQARLPQWDAVEELCRAQLRSILRYQQQLPPEQGVRRQLHVLQGRLGGWSLQVRVIREVTALAVD